MRRVSKAAKYALSAVLLIALYVYTQSSIGFATPILTHGDQRTSTSPETDRLPIHDAQPSSAADAASGNSRRPSSSSSSSSSDNNNNKVDGSQPSPSKIGSISTPTGGHPIDRLIYDAQLSFAELLSHESKTIAEAAQAYRRRRGRHPPPGFDKWFAFAREHNALIIEDFFDGIYDDLAPLWGLEPAVLRKESWDFEMRISIRDGKASCDSDFFWTKIWLEMLQTIDHLLPDMDLPLNAMDEPRVVVPWEDVADYMAKGRRTFKMPRPEEVITDFQSLPKPGTGDLDTPTRDRSFESTRPYWNIVRKGCPPTSAARTTEMPSEILDQRPDLKSTYARPHMRDGFVSNFTLSSDICHQPDLQHLEGIFIAPLSTSSSKVMTPMFGGSKLSVNNEILLPAPMYWAGEERFTGGDDHGGAWADKEDKVVWRGVASGGYNHEHNWRGFQRHRFVAMNNGTTLGRIEKAGKVEKAKNGEKGKEGEEGKEGEAPENFALPDPSYHLRAQKDGAMGSWIGGLANVSFTDLSCSPPEDNYCRYTNFYFKPSPQMPMSEQFGSKYLPDIDGNSFSGRYLGFLRSTSLPIKATIWREWHDARLVAWKHFVPMDSRFLDYYGILEYFLGYEGGSDSNSDGSKSGSKSGKDSKKDNDKRDSTEDSNEGRNDGKDEKRAGRVKGHDHAAEKIAADGKEWAERVLRKEDMQIYTVRLLLEYARLLDDRREMLGWVGDVWEEPKKGGGIWG